MTNGATENQRLAREALHAIVSDPAYGTAALSDPRTMSGLLKDLLPDAPREKSVLTAATDAGLPGLLTDHVASGMDVATASALTVASFTSSTAYSEDVGAWVVGELALALGLSPAAGQQPGAGPAGADPLRSAQPGGGQPGQGAGQPGQGGHQAGGPGPWNNQPPPPGPRGSQPPGHGQWGNQAAGPGQWGNQAAGPGQWGNQAAGPGQWAIQPGGHHAPRPAAAVPSGHTNGMAIAALVLGCAQILVVSVLICAPLALIFGLVARRQIQRTGERGSGMALAGIILGACGLALLAIYLIAVGLAVANR